MLLLAQASVPPQPETLEGARSFVYRTTPQGELRMHAFLPSGTGAPAPAIVFFFGGGWSSGTVQQFVPHAKHLASLGMAGLVADYRVKRRHGTTPLDAAADARAAIEWVRAHAAELNVDPRRILAGGGSAGGHLAAVTGLIPDGITPPVALVLFNPVVDIAAIRPEAAAISPAAYVKKGAPPAVIFHGTADTTVPFASAEKFCADMKAAGNACEVHPAQGEKHGYFNREPWLAKTIGEMEQWLRVRGYLR